MNRKNPRISLNALTEYLTSDSARRRRIVMEQMDPNDFQVIYYQFASDCITRFICDGNQDESILVNEIDRLKSLTTIKQYEQNRFKANAEALEAFLDTYGSIDLAGLEAIEGKSDQPKVGIGKLSISVRPEIHLIGTLYKKGPVAGAIKLYFSKDPKARLTEESGKFPTLLVNRFLQQTNTEVACPLQYSMVIDVFGKTVSTAPKSVIRTSKLIEDGCREYEALWQRELDDRGEGPDSKV